MKVTAGKHLMDLVAVDWFKDTKRMDHVARRQGCAAQVRTSLAYLPPPHFVLFTSDFQIDSGKTVFYFCV